MITDIDLEKQVEGNKAAANEWMRLYYEETQKKVDNNLLQMDLNTCREVQSELRSERDRQVEEIERLREGKVVIREAFEDQKKAFNLAKEAAEQFKAERDALRAELASQGTHTCHEDCQKPACVVRRERDWLLAEKESWGNEFTAVCMAKDERDRYKGLLEEAVKIWDLVEEWVCLSKMQNPEHPLLKMKEALARFQSELT
jgi:hypothetical protein